MKRLASILCLVLLAGWAASALASSTSNVEGPLVKSPTAVPGGWTDSGGETIATATLINALPYSDSDNTCDHTQDYVASCGTNAAPDLFYRYEPTATANATVSLCGSTYDTVVYVLENGVELACNDDFCGLQSEVSVIFVAGRTYIIGVSGFSTACGQYSLNITVQLPCIPVCPPGVQIEGEPVCGPNYFDTYNGGCGSDPLAFLDVTCRVICSETGTFLFQGGNYRDTDRYYINCPSGGTLSGMSDGYRLRLFTGAMPNGVPDCTTYDYTTIAASCMQSAAIPFRGGGAWLWAGPDVFTGIPCGSKYLLTIDAPGCVPGPPCGATATAPATWGGIKNVYR